MVAAVVAAAAAGAVVVVADAVRWPRLCVCRGDGSRVSSPRLHPMRLARPQAQLQEPQAKVCHERGGDRAA